MSSHQPMQGPVPYHEYRQQVSRLVALRYGLHWCAHHLTNWYSVLGSLSIVIAVIFYFADTGHRIMQRHYQAWQVINTAQGKGGSGGRIEALQELTKDKVPLIGVDVAGAFLQGTKLDGAKLRRANFHNSDVRNASLVGADLSDADLSGCNLRNSDLTRARFSGAELNDADLSESNLTGADLSNTNLEGADLHDADLRSVNWSGISSIKQANLVGVKNAPAGFLEWAAKNGAVLQAEAVGRDAK